ncbi:hypothetical protein N4G65_17840 [Streptomyces fulvoviolaceus]|nr:hypothetical protein [Streptomyces fulvoviolaceus]MCT9078394.1 hypothetical protein [Streptomyces fulvoviolaceus]
MLSPQERFEVDAGQIGEVRRHPGARPQRGPVLGGAAGEDQPAAVRQCLADAVQRQGPHGGGEFVEPVEHREDQPPVQEQAGEGDIAVLSGGGRAQLGMVLHEPALHPAAQVQDGRVPGGQREEHGHGVALLPPLGQSQQEPDEQHRLAGARVAEHQQPPGGDTVREEGADLPVTAGRAVRRGRLGQVARDGPPRHGQHTRVRQPPHLRLGLPLTPYGGGEPVGDGLGSLRRGRLGTVGPVGTPGEIGAGPGRQQRRDHGRRVVEVRRDQERPQGSRAEQDDVHEPGAPHA